MIEREDVRRMSDEGSTTHSYSFQEASSLPEKKVLNFSLLAFEK